MPCKCLFALCVVLAINVQHVNSALLQLKIQKRAKECFYEDINQDRKHINLEFEVIEGGELDIGVTVIGPSGMKLLHKLLNFDEQKNGQNEPEKVNLINLSAGKYEICFDNVMASKSSKVVVIRSDDLLDNRKPTEKKTEFAQKSELDDLTQTASKIEAQLEKVQELQDYTQARLHRHLWTQDSTSTRADWMLMLQMCVVVVVGVGQTWYIKAWFESKKTSFRV